MGIKTAGRTSENPLENWKSLKTESMEAETARKTSSLTERRQHFTEPLQVQEGANLQSKETSAAFIDALDVIVSIQEISDTVIYY